MDDAGTHDSGEILVNVLTWTLARIAVGFGSISIAADIVKRFGDHMGRLEYRRRAQRESEQAKEEGHQPH
jgi:hypothetical protein